MSARAQAAARSRAATPVLLVLLIAAATALGSLGGPAVDRVVVGGLVNLVIVVGLYTFIGLTGVFSFGHLGFVAIGAYAVAILTVPVGLKEVLFREMLGPLQTAETSFAVAVLVGALIAAFCALVIAVPLSRMSGLTAGLATIAILVTVNALASNWTSVTNGVQGISGIPTGTTLGVALTTAFLVVVAAWLFQESRMGLMIKASREDPVAARAIGIRVGLGRGTALVVSAFLVGVGGGLYSQLQGNVSPSAFYLAPTFLVLAMLVVGGVGSLSGAVVGAISITALREILRRIEAGTSVAGVEIPSRPGVMEVGLALAMLLILALRPSGIMGGRELTLTLLREPVARVRGRLAGRAGLSPRTSGSDEGGST